LHGQPNLLAGVSGGQRVDQVPFGGDRGPVERDDHIACPQAGIGGGRPWLHACDERSG
jgi:hypothetical protein